MCSITAKTQAQSSDSTFTFTDSTITINQDMIVGDSLGNTTLFAGNEGSDYAGRVGVGSSVPPDKLTVFDETDAGFSLFQQKNTGIGLAGLRMWISGGVEPIVSSSTAAYMPPSTSTLIASATTFSSPYVSCDIPAFEQIAKAISFKTVAPYTTPTYTPTSGSTGSHPTCEGLLRMIILNNGNVGIGVAAPVDKLQVNGNTRIKGNFLLDHTLVPIFMTSQGALAGRVGLGTVTPSEKLSIVNGAVLIDNTTSTSTAATLRMIAGNAAADPIKINIAADLVKSVFKVRTSGFTSIGREMGDQTAVLNLNCFEPNTSAISIKLTKSDGSVVENYKVTNDGRVRAREVKVTMANPFPDYVFAKEYKLMPLNELQAYIKTHQRLPNMTSANVIDIEGIDLGEQNRLLTEKVEELTLYLLQLNKRITSLEQKIGKL
jgi:hypothetical protein